jgi:phospholipid/cholesterol/gamma-HCH transport system substrate-binding protein
MLQTRTIEVSVGIFIALGFAALLVLAIKVSNFNVFGDLNADNSYQITAKFTNVGSLKSGAPVTIAGVRVGRVGAIGIDKASQEALVTLHIENSHRDIPADTSASILTAGLLGEQYVGLEPGGDETLLKNGDQITLTQSALVLEKIIGEFLFSKAAEGKDKK